MSNNATILVIDDELEVPKILAHLLEPEFSIYRVGTGPEGLKIVSVVAPNLIFLDLNLPQMSGTSVLKRLREEHEEIPVIILTTYGGIHSAVQAIKLGAVDYLEKLFDNQKIKQVVRAVLKRKQDVHDLPNLLGIVGESSQIKPDGSILYNNKVCLPPLDVWV